jgi:hypothetical protein
MDTPTRGADSPGPTPQDGIAAAWTEWRGKKAGKEGEIPQLPPSSQHSAALLNKLFNFLGPKLAAIVQFNVLDPVPRTIDRSN